MTRSDQLGSAMGLAIGILIVAVLGGWLWLAVPAALATGALTVKWRGALWYERLVARVEAGDGTWGKDR